MRLPKPPSIFDKRPVTLDPRDPDYKRKLLNALSEQVRTPPPDLGYTQEQCDASGVNFIREGGPPF